MAEDRLIACIVEGAAERVIMEKLLGSDKLIFTKRDLLDEELLKCRKARDFEDKYLGKRFDSKISIYRILDSRREEFKLRKAYKSKVDVINVITAPEIEILVIIKEKKYSDYNKYKSKIKPSEYCSRNLKMGNVKDEEFLLEYFDNVDDLVNVIKEYKSLHKVLKSEMCLADLLK